MAAPKKSIRTLHTEISEWEGDIKWVRSQVEIFQNQLKEIAEKNNHEEVLKGVEHFQNQFIRQQEVSDELLHELHTRDHALARIADIGSDSDLIITEEDPGLKDKADMYKKLFLELKDEFHLFLEKWM